MGTPGARHLCSSPLSPTPELPLLQGGSGPFHRGGRPSGQQRTGHGSLILSGGAGISTTIHFTLKTLNFCLLTGPLGRGCIDHTPLSLVHIELPSHPPLPPIGNCPFIFCPCSHTMSVFCVQAFFIVLVFVVVFGCTGQNVGS